MSSGERRLMALGEAGRALGVVTDTDQLVEVAAAWALKVIDADAASISVLDHARGCLRTIRNLGCLADWEEEHPADEDYPLADYPQTSHLLEEGRAWIGSLDDPATPVEERQLLASLDKRSGMAVGIHLGETVWGELWLSRTAERSPFDEKDLTIGEAFAGLVSAALSHLAARDALRTMAYLDPLTGLGNRRAIDERLEAVFAERQLARPVALVLVDVDDMKLINDNYGHATGDRVLREVGALLSVEASRLPDGLAARIGGDEFGLLTEGARRDEVEAAIGRLTADAARIEPQMGVSCGMAIATARLGGAPTPAAAARALLRLADAAQYRAKRRGRGVTVDAPTTPNAAPSGPAGARLADEALARLRGVDDVLERLAVVASTMAEVLDAAAWGVSRQLGDGPLVTLRSGYDRVGDVDVEAAGSAEGTEFDVDAYPATRAALEGGSFWANMDDGDPAEREFMAANGFAELLAAGARVGDERWLIEIGGDALGGALAPHEGTLRLLVEWAVHGPTGAAGVSSRVGADALSGPSAAP